MDGASPNGQFFVRLTRDEGLKGLEDDESVLEQRINEMKQVNSHSPLDLEDLNLNQLKKMIHDDLKKAYDDKPIGKADLRLS